MFHKWTCGNQPLVHRYKHAYRLFKEMEEDGSLKGKFRTPKKLTILTCHNYDKVSLFERNCKFLGIDYMVLKETRKPWKDVYKLEQVYKFLNETEKMSTYVLFCDAEDVIFLDNPQLVVDSFEKIPHDLIFTATMFPGGWECMPEVRKWAEGVAYGRFLNSGVYIGTWEFTREVIKEACKYITPNSLTQYEYNKSGRGTKKHPQMCEMLPEYPKGAPDQDILRYIHRKFHPRMGIDAINEIIYRN